MEPNKFDNQIKQKLGRRTIQPSAQAWGRLDAMLNVVEETKSKRKFTWIYIAASVVGFLLIGTVFNHFVEKGIIKSGNKVVIQQEENIDNPLKVNEVKKEEIGILNTSNTKEKAIVILDKQNLREVKKEPLTNNNKTEHSIINQINVENNQSKNNTSLIAEKSNDLTVEELLVTVKQNFEKDKITVQKQTVTVNATNLLSQVDGELEYSFREKVINSVSKNLKTVKVAVANRNLE